jgi:trans-2,3-dihydro-3-hydroxyanthranilate isomerase
VSDPGKLRVRVVDVFTTRPFSGNPLAVVLGADGLEDRQMQAMAREFNLSETSFVLSPRAPGADYRMRIFTPARELPFAGHPSIGTAFLLAEEGIVRLHGPVTALRQEVGIGVLPLEVHAEGGRPVRVTMTQGRPELGESYEAGQVAALALALGLASDEVRRDLPVQVSSTGIRSLMAPVRDLDALGRIAVDARALREALPAPSDLSGLYAFVLDGSARVRARFFAPELGIAEDPATGSAAGALGAYLLAHGALPSQGDGLRLLVVQGVEMGRPSELEVHALGKPGGAPSQVRVSGSAVTVMRGEMEAP